MCMHARIERLPAHSLVPGWFFAACDLKNFTLRLLSATAQRHALRRRPIQPLEYNFDHLLLRFKVDLAQR